MFGLLCALCAVATSLVTIGLLDLALPRGLTPRPVGGERAHRRDKARGEVPGFLYLEWSVRAVAHRLASLPLGRLRTYLDGRLVDAGQPLGLCSDEFMALCVHSGALSALVGGGLSQIWGKPLGGVVLLATLLGLGLPLFRLDEIIRQRRLWVSRSLPSVIDLIALAMEGGLDFTRAMTEVEARLPESSPLRFELELLRYKLCLGWSRKEALEELARRVKAPAVRQFVIAVAQGEKRGTPLADLLSVQAAVMRTKRVAAAEQAASRAGVLILLPLLLIFCSVFLVLLGPFVVKFVKGDLM